MVVIQADYSKSDLKLLHDLLSNGWDLFNKQMDENGRKSAFKLLNIPFTVSKKLKNSNSGEKFSKTNSQVQFVKSHSNLKNCFVQDSEIFSEIEMIGTHDETWEYGNNKKRIF